MGVPIGPIPVHTMSWYIDENGLMWAYRGATLEWIQIVDISQLAAFGDVTASSGLTKVGNNIILGGPLLGNTLISSQGPYILLGDDQTNKASFLIYPDISSFVFTYDDQDGTNGTIQISPNSGFYTLNTSPAATGELTVNSNSVEIRYAPNGLGNQRVHLNPAGAIEVEDGIHNTGFKYTANYNTSQLTDDRAITDVGGVKQLITEQGAIGFIQNQLTTPQTGSNFWIDGEGVIGDVSASLTELTAGQINIRSTDLGTYNVLSPTGLSVQRISDNVELFSIVTTIGDITRIQGPNKPIQFQNEVYSNLAPTNPKGLVRLTDLSIYQPLLGYTDANTSSPFNRNLVFYGSSLTLAIGSANITSFQQSFAYLTSVAAGYNYLNYGIPGMPTQQITAGDNSLFNIYKTIKPPVNSGDVLVLECMVNDIIKAGYDVATYTTQLTAIVNYLTATTGWVANHIILYNPSYYFTTAAGQADPEGRHTTYTAAVSGIATSLGTLYLDNWSDMRTAQLSNPIYVYSDNLHMTQVGQAFAANLLTPFITTNFGSAVDYSVTKSASVGNLIVQGNQSVFGQLNVNNLNVINAITNNLLVSISDTRGQAVTAGKLFLGTLNRVSPSGNQQAGLATTYNTGTDASGVYPFNTLNGLAYYTRGDNAADHTFLVGGVVKAYIKGSEGSYNIGYTDGLTHQINGSLLNVNGGGNFTGTSIGNGTKRFMNFIPTVTPTANGTVNVGAYFAPVTNTGTGVLTTTQSGTTATADGTYTLQAGIGGTGTGAVFTVTILGGVATVVSQTTGGVNYTVGDALTFTSIPGITATVATLGYTGGFTWAAQFSNGPILLASITAPTNNFSGTLMNISGVFKAYNTVLNRIAMQTDVAGTATQAPVYNSSGQLVPTTVTGTGAPVLAVSPTFTGTPTLPTGTIATTQAANINSTTLATMAAVKAVNFLKTIFVPTTGGSVTLVNHQYNIVNPAGTLAALTFVMPASPVDGDVVYVKFIQAVTTITWPAAVKGAATTAALYSKVTLVYDSASTNWY